MPPRWVWVGFWVLATVLAGCVVTAILILDTYDRSIWDILYKVLGNVDGPGMGGMDYVWLPDKYTAHVEPPPHSYAKNVETLADFHVWRDMPGGVLAMYEDRPTTHDVPYDGVETVATYDRDWYTLRTFVMPSVFGDETITFYELLPDTGTDIAQYNAVFVIPGSGHSGALDVLGEPGPWQHAYYQDGIAQMLAKAGYATYVIELFGYGERAIDTGGACNQIGKNPTCSRDMIKHKMAVYGISIDDIMTDEITQVLAYVESRPYTQDIAVAGLSLGASMARNQAIVNGGIVDAVVMASGVTSILYSPIGINPPDPEIVACCDTTDIVATIAPMPMYVSAGAQESVILRWEAEYGYSGDMLSDVYLLHGMPENFHYVVHGGRHEYHTESVIEFLDTHLGFWTNTDK